MYGAGGQGTLAWSQRPSCDEEMPHWLEMRERKYTPVGRGFQAQGVSGAKAMRQGHARAAREWWTSQEEGKEQTCRVSRVWGRALEPWSGRWA